MPEPAPAAVVAEGQAQRFVPGGEVAPDWWRFFQSAPLDTLVRQAIPTT
jgi:outer membrane protein TolC